MCASIPSRQIRPKLLCSTVQGLHGFLQGIQDQANKAKRKVEDSAFGQFWLKIQVGCNARDLGSRHSRPAAAGLLYTDQ